MSKFCLAENGNVLADTNDALSKVEWTPEELTLTAWWDASDADTINEDNSPGFVSQWDDKSGNGNHALQGNGSRQPSYNTSDFNNKPSITFDGTDDSLNPALQQLTTGTMVVVIEAVQKGGTANNTSIGATSNFGGAGIHFGHQNFGSGSATFQAWNGTVGNIPNKRYNGRTSFTAAYEPAICLAPFDGITTASKNYCIGSMQSTPNATDQYKGQISEIIIIPTLLSISDQEKLEGYLAWKWSMVDKLPSDHPWKNGRPVV